LAPPGKYLKGKPATGKFDMTTGVEAYYQEAGNVWMFTYDPDVRNASSPLQFLKREFTLRNIRKWWGEEETDNINMTAFSAGENWHLGQPPFKLMLTSPPYTIIYNKDGLRVLYD
jgi:hypothetical protein